MAMLSVDENNKKTKHKVVCICGSGFHSVQEASSVYDDGIETISCDICGQDVNENMILWHCPMEYNIFHPDGYDICNNCYMKDTDVTELTHHLNASIKSPLILPIESCECGENVNCRVLKHFIAIMKQYNDNYCKIGNNMDKTQLIIIINDYLHLMHQHDESQHFQAIVDNLGYCDITKCVKFQRNYRNRMNTKDDDYDIQKNYNVVCSILDIMHCYFQHCYDIGNRLPAKDQNAIYNIANEEKQDPIIQHLCNTEKIQITNITQENRKKFQTIYSRFNDKIYNKYNQLFTNDEEKKNNDDNINEDGKYQFGFLFNYANEDEDDLYDFGKKISPKFSSFKEELLRNPFATLNIDQYKLEYEKATVLFNSEYCKTNKNFESGDGFKGSIFSFTLENLLALMMYCNYTNIQYEFSKTYRENNGDNHQYFYFWGLSLQRSIRDFATKATFPNDKKFYHGINQHLYLPSYIGTNRKEGICVYCPMSTSSSFEVATNFASNKGLIIELQLKEEESKLIEDYNNSKYLSLSWLSDYGNEKEHLFIQGSPMVIVANVIQLDMGYEYGKILKAITLIDEVFNGNHDSISWKDESMRVLVQAILDDRLSATISKYKPFQSLSMYGKQILDTFFAERQDIIMHYWSIQKHYSFISELFVYSDFQCIKLDNLMVLCPNVEYIIICKIKLSARLFENILNFLSKLGDDINLLGIEITSLNVNNIEMTVDHVINQYSTICSKLNAFIYSFDGGICIDRCSKIDFIAKIVSDSLSGVELKVSEEIQILTQQLVQNRLSNANDDNDDQDLFNKWCNEQKELKYRFCGLDNMEFLDELTSHPNIDGWINMAVLIKLFPNMNSFTISTIKLSTALIQNIATVLESTILEELFISNPIEDKLSKEETVGKYTETFATLKWTVLALEWPEISLYFKKM